MGKLLSFLYSRLPSWCQEPYSYGYSVDSPESGDIKSAQEEKDSQGVVRGSYSLVQPDGRVRVVSYVADALHGFRADVKYLPA